MQKNFPFRMYQSITWKDVILFSLVISSVLSLQEWRGEFRDHCRTNDHCDKTRFLECVNDFCGCKTFTGHKWISEENSCRIMEGFRCDQRGNMTCVPHASCRDGRCECNDKYLRDGFGLCKLSHGSVCSQNEENEPCSPRYLLECVREGDHEQSTCKCRGEGVAFVWDENKRKCVATVGGKCDLQDDSGYGRDDQGECSENSKCVRERGVGVCRCEDGFVQTKEGTCLLTYGQECLTSNQCNKFQFLICEEKKCACEFHGQYKYDNETKQCRVLVGEGCKMTGYDYENFMDGDMTRGNPSCVKDAFCKPRHEGSGKGVCECLDGFDPKHDGTCTKLRGHGKLCSASMDCDQEKFLECAMDNLGVGSCQCQRSQNTTMFYDKVAKKCRVFPGKSCLRNNFCSENAYCEGRWCVCNQGYKIEGANCVKMGTEAEASLTTTAPTTTTELVNFDIVFQPDKKPHHCDHYLERTLDWKKCQCEMKPETHFWVANETSCLALVGSHCSLDIDCIPHAICDDSVCHCSPSALTFHSKFCIPYSIPEGHRNHPEHIRDCGEKLALGPEVATYSSSALEEPLKSLILLTAAIIQVMSQYCFL